MASFSTAITLWGESRLTLTREDWLRLARRLRIELPADFPWPSGETDFYVELEPTVGSAGGGVRLHCRVTGPPPPGDGFCGFAIGGPVRLAFFFELATTAEADDLLSSFGESSAPLRAAGRLELELPVKLPTPPEWDLIAIESGNRDGWITLRLVAEFSAQPTDSAENLRLTLHAEATDLFTARLRMPGATRTDPWLTLGVTRAVGEFSWTGGQNFTGRLRIEGEARAFVDAAWLITPQTAALSPIIALLQQADADQAGITGTFAGEVTFDAQSPALTLECRLPDARVRVALHDLLAYARAMVHGQPPPASTPAPAGAPPDELALALDSLQVRISREPMVALGFTGRLPGLATGLPAFIRVGYRQVSGFEFSFGLGQADPKNEQAGIFRLPLQVPHVSRRDLEPLAALQHRLLRGEGLERYKHLVDQYFAALEIAFGLLDTASSGILARPDGDRWLIEPQSGAARPSSDQPVVLAAGHTTDTHEFALAYNTGEGWQPLLIKPAVQFERFALVFPMQNPRDIRVSGTMRFTCEGPFAALSRLPVTVGLSVDMIYASVDSDGGAVIEIPPLLPGYEPGRIVIGQLRLGFGYTKRSFAFSFAGECVLPRQLVDDLDTSDRLGFGLRLPERSNLAVRFDLIPIVLGKLVIPMPMLQLNCDLRRSGNHSLIKDRRTCEPGWDGLQVIAPGILRLGFERFSYNPFLSGLFACSNSDFAGDIQLGNADTGLTACLDNAFWAYGFDSYCAMAVYPIISPPFFDDACVALRAGGFALGFDLQRPLPTFSPMALFELLALVSDPLNYPVAPRGELADMVRISLTEARLELPPAVTALFPALGNLPQPPRDATINLATYIRVLQVIGRVAAPLIEEAVAAAQRHGALAQRWHEAAARVQGGALLPTIFALAESLPAEMRQFAYRADFLGFHGQACLGFVSARELLAALTDKPSQPRAAAAITAGMAWDADAMQRFQPLDPQRRTLTEPTSPQAWLHRGAFTGITADDVREIPVPNPAPRFTAADISDELIFWLKTDQGKLAAALRPFFNNDQEKNSLDWKRRAPDGDDRQTVAAALNQALIDPKLFNPRARSGRPAWLVARFVEQKLSGDTLRVHNRLLLELAEPRWFGRAPSGLMCAATLRIFSAEFSLLGWVGADADFALVTRGTLSAPRLPLAGCLDWLPLQIVGRATLRRDTGPAVTPTLSPFQPVADNKDTLAASAPKLELNRPLSRAIPGVSAITPPTSIPEPVAVLELSAYAAADLLPGLLRLEVGSEKNPVIARLRSNGDFFIDGSATLKLLGDHAVAEGRLLLTPQSLLLIGKLTAFGATATQARVELRAATLNVTAVLTGRPWGVDFTADCTMQATPGATRSRCEGAVIFSAAALALGFTGRGVWEATEKNRWHCLLEGRPTWQDHAWAQGSIEWDDQSLTVSLHDTVTLSLRDLLERSGHLSRLADVLPGFGDLRLDLAVSVQLHKRDTAEVTAELSGRWQLAVQLAGSPDAHVIATNQLACSISLSAPPQPLLDLSALPLLPLDALRLPAQAIAFGKTARVGLSKVKTLHVEWDNVWYPPLPAPIDSTITLPEHFHQSVPALTLTQLPKITLTPLQLDLRWHEGRLGVYFTAPQLPAGIFSALGAR